MGRAFTAMLILLALFGTACTAEREPALPTLAVLPSPTPTVREQVAAVASPALATVAPTASPSAPPTTPSLTPTTTPSPTWTWTASPTLTLTTPPPVPMTPAAGLEAGPTGVGGLPTPRLTAIRLPSATPSPTLTLTATVAPTRASTPIGEASITAANSLLVNIVDAPSFNARIIRAAATGENLFLIGRSWNNEWFQVRTMDGVEGWVLGLYLVIWGDLNRVVVTHLEPTRPPVAMVGTFGLGGHVMNMVESSYGLMRQAGMTWIKVQYRYSHGEPGSAAAPLIQAAHRAGFKIVLGVVGDPGQLIGIPGYHAAYANFVAQAAAAGADAIEIWNEPNIDREWPRGYIHGGNYTDLLRPAYTAIKAARPTTLVISGAPAPTGFFGPAGCGDGGCNDDIFLTQMAFAGAQNYLDCVGLHHNDGIVSPTQMSGDPRGDHPTYFLRGVISRVPSAFNSRPVCFTEVGYLSPEGYGGGLPPNFAWANSTTTAEHAQWLGEAVRLSRSSGRVAMLIVWNVDFDVYRFDDPMAGYAIRRPGGDCPACASLAAAING